MSPAPLPPQTVLPYLLVHDAAAALDFYARAFGAVERVRLALPDGRIHHAELELSGNQLWLSDEVPELGFPSPRTLGGATMGVVVYVPDVDALCARALAAGATLLRPLTDESWARTATLRDPFGHAWTFATRLREPPRTRKT